MTSLSAYLPQDRLRAISRGETLPEGMALDDNGDPTTDPAKANLPLPLGSPDAPWLQAGDTALARVRDFAPTALVVALGLDASESDPLQGLKVTGAGFHAMAKKIASLGLPTVLVQEGGYLSDDLGQNLVHFLKGFEEGR